MPNYNVINSYLPFSFLHFSMTTLLQLGVCLEDAVKSTRNNAEIWKSCTCKEEIRINTADVFLFNSKRVNLWLNKGRRIVWTEKA